MIYLSSIKAIVLSASDEYDIQKLYLEIKEKKALHTEKNDIRSKNYDGQKDSDYQPFAGLTRRTVY